MRHRWFGILTLVAAAGLTVTVVASPLPQAGQAQPPIPLSPEFAPKPYTVAAGDVIKLDFFNLYATDLDMAQTYTVQDSGTIRLKFVGDLRVHGMTLAEIQEAVRRALEPDYYPEGVVTVTATIARERLQEVTVNGYVNSPGLKRLTGSEMTVSRAINQAGNFSSLAGEEIDVRRVRADGRVENFGVTRTQLLEGNDPQLLNGDEVIVKEGKFFMVNGEVNSPGQKRWENDMTVLKAVGLAGGLTNRGKYGHIMRPVKQDDGSIKYEKITKLKDETLVLPGDQLKIDRKWFGG